MRTPKPPGQQLPGGVVRLPNGAMGVQGSRTRPRDTRPISHLRPPSRGADLPMPAGVPPPVRGTAAPVTRARTQDRPGSAPAR